MLIVLFHESGAIAADKYFDVSTLQGIFRFGSCGVDFFFVISGFIICYIHFNDISHPERIGRYIWNRASRIYPVYWIVFLSVMSIALCMPSIRGAIPHDPWLIIHSLLLFPQDPNIVGGTGAPVIIVAWSLQYEIVFYCIFAIFIISARVGILSIALIIVYFVLFRYIYPSYPLPFIYMMPSYFVEFGIGVLVAMLARRMPDLHIAFLLPLGIAGFLSLAVYECVGSVPYPRPIIMSLGYSLFFATIIAGSVALERARRDFFDFRYFVFFGDASYALYLVHFPLISFASKLLSKILPGNLMWSIASLVAMFTLCCVAAAIFHKYVEKPMHGALRNIGVRHRERLHALANK